MFLKFDGSMKTNKSAGNRVVSRGPTCEEWFSGFSGQAGFRAGFGPGSDLSLSKCFRSISGLHTKLFYDIQSNDFFFRCVPLLCSLR